MTRLAVAQLLCPADDDLTRRHLAVAAIERAADDGAAVVVLPELAACGYRLDEAHLDARAERGDGSGPVLGEWCEAARRRGIAVVGGFAERIAGDRIANSAAVIDHRGAVTAVYQKLHLFGDEREVFVPGELGLPIVDVAGIRLGVLICYDLRFPEAVRILALRGAQVIAVPTAWVRGFDAAVAPDGRVGQVDGAVVQANLSQVFIACADQVGADRDVTFLGRSVVIDPYGNVLPPGPLSARRVDLATVDIDLDDCARAQDRGPGISPRENRRVDVYGADLGYSMAALSNRS